MNMKRNAPALVALIAAVLLSGCPVLNTGKRHKGGGADGPFTVDFHMNGGKGTTPDSITDEDSPIILPDDSGFSRDGYSFVGWNTQPDGKGNHYDAGDEYTPTRTLMLYAEWDRAYTINFSVNGGMGTPPSAQTATAGVAITLPDGNGLSKANAEFGGWNVTPDGTGERYDAGASFTPRSNITLYVHWNRAGLYTVSFNLNGGEGTVPPAQTVENGSYSYTMLPDGSGLSKTGFVFRGWNTEADGTGSNYATNAYYTPKGSITLYARWGAGPSIVSFDLNGGSGPAPAPETVADGAAILLSGGSGLSKTDALFGGWNSKDDGTGDNYPAYAFYTPSGSITLYAKWNPVYTVRFDVNGGNGSTPAARTQSGTSYSIDLDPSYSNNLTKANCVFGGWNTMANGTGINYGAGASINPTSSLTLYANWLPQNASYTVTYNLNGGSAITAPVAQTVNAGDRILLSPSYSNGNNVFTKTGFVFGGWNTKADGTGDNYSAGSFYYPANTITFYIKWEPVYTVTYNLNGGTGTTPNAQAVRVGNDAYLSFNQWTVWQNDETVIVSFTKSGFVFGGWNTRADGTGDNYSYSTYYTPTGDITLYARWTVPAVTAGDFGFREEATGCTLISYSGSGGAISIPAMANEKPVTAIAADVFYGNTNITSVNIPHSITTIGDEAFAKCTNLASLSIGNGLKTIGERAFYQCQALTSVDLPYGFEVIGYMAFSECSSLASITIPNSVTTIMGMAFYYCSSLTSVTIPGSVTSLCGPPHGTQGGLFTSCTSLKSVIIENGITYIPAGTFSGCRSLTSVTIPNSVTAIGQADNAFPAFQGCTSLTSITLPNNLQIIYAATFSGAGLTSITIPASVTYANGLYPLREITFLGSATVLDIAAVSDGGVALVAAYAVGGAGRYTASGTGADTVWTKQ